MEKVLKEKSQVLPNFLLYAKAIFQMEILCRSLR